MPPPLTVNELVARAQAEIAQAELAHAEIVTGGRTSGRTARLRAAKARARKLLRRAIWRGLSDDDARKVYETAPPDPEFGTPKW